MQFQRDEIEALNTQDGETERLRERVRVLEHSGKLLETAAESYQALYEAEPSVLSMLAAVEKSLREVAAYDRSLENIVEQSASASATVEDMAYALRDYVQTIDADPAELEHLQGRLAELERLHRKYGPDLLTHLAKVIRELDNLGLAETKKADIRRQLTELRDNYARAAGDLRTIRHRVSKTLEQSVTEELRSLAMPMADFSIRWKPVEPSATGMDLPVFLLAPNPGEDPGPLAQIASGGELSRVMLALRTVLAVDGGDKTLVFDEIDAGIGGGSRRDCRTQAPGTLPVLPGPLCHAPVPDRTFRRSPLSDRKTGRRRSNRDAFRNVGWHRAGRGTRPYDERPRHQ